jgi:hypothetical protein
MNTDLRQQFKKHLESGETLVIEGDLTLDDEELIVIPFLRVRGNLVLKQMFRLQRIYGLEVAGNLTIDECDLIEFLPRLCVVGKTLTLKHNTLLSDVGLKLSCRAIEIDSCTSVSILELGIDQCRSITLKHLNNLELVTQKRLTWIPSEVLIEDCGLVQVPSGLRVGTTLKVINSRNLESIGSEVFSGGDMDFGGCVGLKTIGSKLFCGANLILKNTGLKELPLDLLVEGIIEVAGSPIRNLKEIAKTTTVQWRGRSVEAPGSGSVDQQMARDVLKIESRLERERAIRRLTTTAFLKAAGERFSRHSLDPDAAARAVQAGIGGGDLYWVSKPGSNPRRRRGVPRYSEAAIMHSLGWWEVRNTFQLDWQRN